MINRASNIRFSINQNVWLVRYMIRPGRGWERRSVGRVLWERSSVVRGWKKSNVGVAGRGVMWEWLGEK